MTTAQRTRPRAVVGAPSRAAWQLKSALRHSVSAAPRTITFYTFFLQLLPVNYFFISTQQINGTNNMVIGQIGTYIGVIGLFCKLCCVCT